MHKRTQIKSLAVTGKLLRLLLMLTLLVIIETDICRASIINVPADQPTVQAAINATMLFDTVLVADGIYYENIVFRGKAVTVASHFIIDDDPRHILNTILDGSSPSDPDSASVVRIVDSESSSTKLIGFTITGGKGTIWTDAHGAGDYREGGGILCENSSPVIQYNLIINNEASDDFGTVSAGGGGIRYGDGDPLIKNNIIMHNTGKYGAGIVSNYATGEISNNVIAYNKGGEDFFGGGVWKLRGLSTILNNNTIVGNESTYRGGGVYAWLGTVSGIGNIIWGNTATTEPQVSVNGGIADLTYSNVEGGWAGASNIDADPQFVGDYFYLSETSPCVDAGDPSFILNEQPDAIGSDSALWPSRGSRTSDMGAYGGIYATTFELFTLLVNSRIGQVPHDVEFELKTALPVDSVSWSFGDGDSAFVISPTHSYITPGTADVSYEIISGADVFNMASPSLIAAAADTIYSVDVSAQFGMPVEVPLYLSNAIAIRDLIIPIHYNGTLELQFDSSSISGCRTASFATHSIVDDDPVQNQLAVHLQGDPNNNGVQLDPGDGQILSLFFSLSGSPSSGQTATIQIADYGSQVLSFLSDFGDYIPFANSATVDFPTCCLGIRGNIDGDLDDQITVADLTYLVSYMFRGGESPICLEEGNVDGDPGEDIGIADITFLVAYMFGGGPQPPSCF